MEKLAGSMRKNFGVKAGDRVVIYMPMVVESVIAMLACARLGATHVVVFGGFSANELANRILDSKPVLLICANAGKEVSRIVNYKQIIDEALTKSRVPELPTIIFQRPNLQKPLPLAAH